MNYNDENAFDRYVLYRNHNNSLAVMLVRRRTAQGAIEKVASIDFVAEVPGYTSVNSPEPTCIGGWPFYKVDNSPIPGTGELAQGDLHAGG